MVYTALPSFQIQFPNGNLASVLFFFVTFSDTLPSFWRMIPRGLTDFFCFFLNLFPAFVVVEFQHPVRRLLFHHLHHHLHRHHHHHLLFFLLLLLLLWFPFLFLFLLPTVFSFHYCDPTFADRKEKWIVESKKKRKRKKKNQKDDHDFFVSFLFCFVLFFLVSRFFLLQRKKKLRKGFELPHYISSGNRSP